MAHFMCANVLPKMRRLINGADFFVLFRLKRLFFFCRWRHEIGHGNREDFRFRQASLTWLSGLTAKHRCVIPVQLAKPWLMLFVVLVTFCTPMARVRRVVNRDRVMMKGDPSRRSWRSLVYGRRAVAACEGQLFDHHACGRGEGLPCTCWGYSGLLW